MKVLLFLIIISSANAQSGGADSTFDLNKLDYEKLKQRLVEDAVEEKSYGWFPTPSSGLFQIGVYEFGNTYNYDLPSNISSKNFFLPNQKLSGDIDDLEDDDRIFREKNSDDEDDDYPETYSEHFGLYFQYSYFKFNAGIAHNNGIIYSQDKTKKFLNNKGELKNIRELNIFHFSEWAFSPGLEIEVPIYGGFYRNNYTAHNSYYYLSGGITLDIPFTNEVTQYLQIASPKNDLRYENGKDSLRLIHREFDNLQFLRYNLDLGLGWSGAFDTFGVGIGVKFEFHTSLMLDSYLDDANWKQIRYGLKMSIFYSDFIGSKEMGL